MKSLVRHWVGVPSILALILSWAVIGPAQPGAAAAGDVIADVVVPEGEALGNSVAFDGQYLYYTQYNGASLNRINVPPPGSSAGVGEVSVPISGAPSGINAISYDAGRDMFWAAGGDGLSIYLLSKSGAATLRFTVDPINDRPGNCKWQCLTEINSLAYDRADDTIWYAPDASFRIYHYRSYADILGTAVLVSDSPYVDLDVAPNDLYPQCGFNNGTGVAVGGSHLFVRTATGQTTCPYYFEYTKTGTKLAWYPSDLPHAQDLECDNLSYGVSVIWARDSGDGHIRAFEQPSAGACVFGGGASQPPAPLPPPPPLPLGPLGLGRM